jgi:IS6 family transposase
MSQRNLFKWHHFEAEIILLCVCWYLRYALSYRDLEEMMLERGLSVDHTTLYLRFSIMSRNSISDVVLIFKTTNDSYRVDETYIKVKDEWKYLYRAVDAEGNTIDFLLRAKRDAQAAKRFLAL